MLTFRRRVELTTGPLLVLLARLPRVVPFLVVMGLVVAGLTVGGVVGALLLGLLAAFLGLLLFLAWPTLLPPSRTIRLLVVLLVSGRAVSLLF